MDFQIKNNEFLKNGKPIKIISGAVHYFRNLPDTWDDIFKKIKALGCNCVETYCAWNMHEKIQGQYDFSGNLDIAAFIRMAQKEDLMVIVRPGPYICAEWEFGGLPWWIMANDDMEIRCMNKQYIQCFEDYLDKLFEEIRPLLCTNGGPIIMLQCENEYGYYGDDKDYLEYLAKSYKEKGIDVPLFTSDGTQEKNLLDGSIDGLLPTLNFGSRVEENFKAFNSLYPDKPKMCMEMWNGWFDAWGDSKHHTTSAENYAAVVDDMLKIGSVNMYMFIGGTNFGFTSGANHYEKFAPDVTSYDYDALLTEAGDVTPKYYAVRNVIKKYVDTPLPSVPANRPKKAYGKFLLTQKTGLFANLNNISKPIKSEIPKNMEKYGIGYGYIAYETVLNREYIDAVLSLESLGDRAHVYLNHNLIGILYINEDLSIKINAQKGDTLTILCENMGRANFGPKMMRKKGIAGRCLIDGKIHFNWNVYPLPMDNLSNLDFSENQFNEKTEFYKGSVDIDEPYDTFLKLENFKKGFVTINGFNIGRYWEIGPQKTLYVPKSILQKGENEFIVFESDGLKGIPQIELCDIHDLGENN